MEKPRLYEVYLLESEIIALNGRLREVKNVLSIIKSEKLIDKYRQEEREIEEEIERKEEQWNTMF